MNVEARNATPSASGSTVGTRSGDLDGLRAIAMTLVFVYHFGIFAVPLLEIGPQLAAPSTWGARLIPNLQVGVEVFFVLSGYLIYRPFAFAHAAGQPRPNLLRYAARRALRIYPAYWVALVVLIARHDIYVNGAANFLKHASLTHLYFSDYGLVGTREPGMVVAWTLVVEASFYAFVPLWALLARRLSLRVEVGALATLAVLGLFVRWWGAYHRLWPWTTILPPAFVTLAPGMIAAVAVAHRERWTPRFARLWSRRVPWYLASLLVLVWMARVAYGSPLFAIFIEGELLAWHKLLAPFAAMFAVLPVVLGGPRPRRGPGLHQLRSSELQSGPTQSGLARSGLAHPAMVAIGTVSYGAYLWHHPLMYHHIDRATVNGTSAFNAALLMVGLFVFVLGVAGASWWLVERPALALGERLGSGVRFRPRTPRWTSRRARPGPKPR